jgi:AcrR family transcriptional regulator
MVEDAAETESFAGSLTRLRVAPRTGTQARTTEAIEQILNATLAVLARDGLSSLTLRRVAAECGTGLGNVSYHFPTKEDLLNGLLDALLAAYSEHIGQLKKELPKDDREQLKAMVVTLLLDAQTMETTYLFPELWSMANHFPEVDTRLQDFYRKARGPAIDLLQRLNPALSADDAETLCIFFASFVEGSLIFAGHGKRYADRMPDLAALAIRTFLHLAETVQPKDLHAMRQEWAERAGGKPRPSAS